jgi:hypothetical protein
MTKSIQTHIHLFNNSTTPTVTNNDNDTTLYRVVMPGIDEKVTPAMTHKRGVTGALLVTRLLDGSGNLVKFRDITVTISCNTAEKDRLMSLVGVACYYVPILHDEHVSNIRYESNGTTQQGYPVLLSIDRVQHLDPFQQYWVVGLTLTENSIA